jgi:hypothetical protein
MVSVACPFKRKSTRNPQKIDYFVAESKNKPGIRACPEMDHHFRGTNLPRPEPVVLFLRSPFFVRVLEDLRVEKVKLGFFFAKDCRP